MMADAVGEAYGWPISEILHRDAGTMITHLNKIMKIFQQMPRFIPRKRGFAGCVND
jgi:hypothetical protein